MQAFESFEHYASALGHADLRILALGRSRAPWEMFRTVVDGIPVRLARDGGPSLFEASIASDGIALMLCIDAAGKVCGNGRTFGPRSVLVIPGRTAVQSTSLDAVYWISVFLPASRLRLPQAAGGGGPRVACRVVDVPAAEYAALMDTARRVISAAMEGAFTGNPVGQQEAARQIIQASRAVILGPASSQESIQTTGRPRLPRAGIIHEACRTVEDRAGKVVHVDELASAAGVSLRTLNNAFREQLGVSARRFIRAYTLNAARRALRSAEPGSVSVSEVAAGLGIWEWGRFSRDYHELFGELPSATLRRKRLTA